LRKLAKVEKLLLKEWGDLVDDIIYLDNAKKMRVRFKEPLDDAFLDIYISPLSDKVYAYHFQLLNGIMFRLDTYPGEKRAKGLPTYPVHFHSETQQNVISPPFPIKNHYLNDLHSFISYIFSTLIGERL